MASEAGTGAATGALQGASAGAVFGVPGAVVGGLIGGVAGLFGGRAKKKARKAMAAAQTAQFKQEAELFEARKRRSEANFAFSSGQKRLQLDFQLRDLERQSSAIAIQQKFEQLELNRQQSTQVANLRNQAVSFGSSSFTQTAISGVRSEFGRARELLQLQQKRQTAGLEEAQRATGAARTMGLSLERQQHQVDIWAAQKELFISQTARSAELAQANQAGAIQGQQQLIGAAFGAATQFAKTDFVQNLFSSKAPSVSIGSMQPTTGFSLAQPKLSTQEQLAGNFSFLPR